MEQVSLKIGERMKEIRNTRQLTLYDAGRKQWDANVSVTMIMRGIK